MASQIMHTPHSRFRAALLAAVLAVGALCGTATANTAPLDTLREAGGDSITRDARYAAPAMDISRKLLPDPGATTVPRSRTPARPPRLDNPIAGAWSFHRARQAAIAGQSDAMHDHLQAALDAAPGRADYRWWQTLRAAKGLDSATFVRALPRGVRALLASPLSRGRFVALAHQAALLLVGIFWSVLTAAMLAAGWRFLAHDLSARFFKDRRHPLRRGLPLLVPLVFVLLKPGWFGFLAAISVPLLLVARGHARHLLAATWLAALILVVPFWTPLRMAAPALDPDSESVLLDQAAVMPPSAALTGALRDALAAAEDPDRRARLQTALAIQEARRGRFTASNELFAAVLAHEPDNYPALVGMANNTYFLGHLDRAVTRYEEATRLHPRRGEIPYNLAQVYFKKLFVPEATEALAEARRLGFEAPASSESQRGNGYAPVVYPGLTATQMAASCRYEAPFYPPLVTVSAWRGHLGVPGVAPLALVGIPFLLAVSVMFFSVRQRDPRECENCGMPLCRSCCKVRDNAWLCPDCGETSDRARSDMILATLLKNRSRDEGLARSARVVRLGRLLPGAGHLASDRVVAAWFRLSLLAGGLFLMGAAWSFDPGASWTTPGLLLESELVHPRWLPLPAALWTGWTTPGVLTGAALVAAAWLLALLDSQGLRRGLHDRHSLVPATAARTTAGAEAP